MAREIAFVNMYEREVSICLMWPYVVITGVRRGGRAIASPQSRRIGYMPGSTRRGRIGAGITYRRKLRVVVKHDFKDGNGSVPAHRHSNGCGWVADTAQVDRFAYVGEHAQVYGNARVAGDAKVYGKARVYDNAQVYENARVSGNARVYGDARVFGVSVVRGNAWVHDNAWVARNAVIYGDAEIGGVATVGEGKRVCGKLDTAGMM